jgi:hypothetical protein
MYCREILVTPVAAACNESFWKVHHPISKLQQGRTGGTKTDRRPTLWGFFGLSWEREYYDSN